MPRKVHELSYLDPYNRNPHDVYPRDKRVLAALDKLVHKGRKRGVFESMAALYRRLREVYDLRYVPTEVTAMYQWRRRGNVSPSAAIHICALPEVREAGIRPADLCVELRIHLKPSRGPGAHPDPMLRSSQRKRGPVGVLRSK